MLELFMIVLCLLSGAASGPERLAAPVEASAPVSAAQDSATASVSAEPVVRTEHFSMRGLPVEGPDGAPPLGLKQGVMALRRAETPDRQLHEREVTFSSAGIRVHHTEEIIGSDRRLVWREFRPDGARTWVAEWNAETGTSTTTGYGWRRETHGALGLSPEARVPSCGPLELLDRMRSGSLRPGQALAIVEPASAGLTDVVIRMDADVLRAHRSDGSVVCLCAAPRAREEGAKDRLESASDRGLAFGSGTVMVPIEKAAYARSRKRWFIPTRPAHERMLARIPKRR